MANGSSTISSWDGTTTIALASTFTKGIMKRLGVTWSSLGRTVYSVTDAASLAGTYDGSFGSGANFALSIPVQTQYPYASLTNLRIWLGAPRPSAEVLAQ